tara:strand:- start:324 stop:548 length:225 start_codon:yes stop_codon:yes gene_type:complete
MRGSKPAGFGKTFAEKRGLPPPLNGAGSLDSMQPAFCRELNALDERVLHIAQKISQQVLFLVGPWLISLETCAR